ncbi:Hexaprenyldihydroxybenzoate methyltransferase, mitochondrial [Lecanora helva]
MTFQPTPFRNVTFLLRKFNARPYSSSASSVNPTEVSHFDKLASSWWDPHGSSRLLHQMNPLRHQFISSCLTKHATQSGDSHASKLSFLDIGCGGGIFAESAARLHRTEKVIGIDPSNEVVSVAQEHARQDPLLYEKGRLEYRNLSMESMPLPQRSDDKFDIVTLFEVIEHISQPAPFLDSCLPFVKPGGWLILSTIARTWTSWLTTKFVAEDVVRMVPQGTHDWNKYINEHELMKFFGNKIGWGKDRGLRSQGCLYIPGLGWKFVDGGEQWGNYFFGIRKNQE